MKTAISLPDGLFERIDSAASELGLSRSAFLARAAEHYLHELDTHALEARINDAVAAVGDPRDTWVVRQGATMLGDPRENW
ncbi:MAG: ribbon-helix-helix protein, CopG family [Cryobacterium sp.]|nr:ribbon-helix-helix protein, CopG family [Cryobacterium sp.]